MIFKAGCIVMQVTFGRKPSAGCVTCSAVSLAEPHRPKPCGNGETIL